MDDETTITNEPEVTSETVTTDSEPIVIESTEPVITDTYSIDDIVVRLENLERLQVAFFNDVTDILLFAVGVAIGLMALKEFMDRGTRW